MGSLRSRWPSTKYPSSAVRGSRRTFGFLLTGSLGSLCLPPTESWWQHPPAVQLTTFQHADPSFLSRAICSLLLQSALFGRDIGGERCYRIHQSSSLKTSTRASGR